LLLLLPAIALIASCKKDKNDDNCTCPSPSPTVVTSANDYFKLAVGNYWVYDNVKIDTLGVETVISSTDSAYVSGTTVVHGNTYYNLFDFYYTILLRDSSGYMIDTNSVIHFTTQVFDVPVAFSYIAGNIGYTESMTVRNPVSVTVPAGTFTAYDWKITLHNMDPNYQWAFTRYSHDYYSAGIGKVKQEYFYYSQPDHYERRLTRYHVQ
jgi:hypothetical protein